MNEKETVIALVDPRETNADEVELLRRKLLSSDERESIARLVGTDHQHDRVVARALVRLALSEYFPIAPNEWKFERDQFQKPFVVGPTGLPSFQFSLSHTRGLIAVLVSRARRGGVDVEQMERNNDLPLIATRICAASELEALNRLAGEAWKERFFELWTLKEAYAKARGLGLSLPWEDIAFDIDSNRAVTVRFGAKIEDDPDRWNFSLDRITPTHMLAAAVSEGSEISLRRVAVRADSAGFQLAE